MSLYGLDILVRPDGKYVLDEVGGINAGMGGFQQIYGDDRVKDAVFSMLQERYGKITVNNGEYAKEERAVQYKKKHPIRSAFGRVTRLFSKLSREPCMPEVLRSRKAYVGWIEEETENGKKPEFPFEVYMGQQSTVLNSRNDLLSHPMVNPYVAQEVTENKLLQYLLLKDSDVGEFILPTATVGLGFTDENALEQILNDGDAFILKPARGVCGRGVHRLTKEEAEVFLNTRGPADDNDVIDILMVAKRTGRITRMPKYIEDYIDAGEFIFEMGIALIQPFVDTERRIDGENVYTSVRAIVCNGRFVDAYMRYSTDHTVNLSRDAKAAPFKREGFAEVCEKIVDTFERRCAKYEPQNLRRALYARCVDERGRTTDAERERDIQLVKGMSFVKTYTLPR